MSSGQPQNQLPLDAEPTAGAPALQKRIRVGKVVGWSFLVAWIAIFAFAVAVFASPALTNSKCVGKTSTIAIWLTELRQAFSAYF